MKKLFMVITMCLISGVAFAQAVKISDTKWQTIVPKTVTFDARDLLQQRAMAQLKLAAIQAQIATIDAQLQQGADLSVKDATTAVAAISAVKTPIATPIQRMKP